MSTGCLVFPSFPLDMPRPPGDNSDKGSRGKCPKMATDRNVPGYQSDLVMADFTSQPRRQDSFDEAKRKREVGGAVQFADHALVARSRAARAYVSARWSGLAQEG